MLYSEQIRKEIQENSLIAGFINLEKQLHSTGFDLTLAWVDEPVIGGGYEGWIAAGGDSSGAPHQPMSYDNDEWLYLPQGSYVALYNELIRIPEGIVAQSIESPLLARCGASITPVRWEPGYKGRAQTLLIVHNRSGFRVQRNSTLMRMEFAYLPPVLGTRYSPETITLGAG